MVAVVVEVTEVVEVEVDEAPVDSEVPEVREATAVDHPEVVVVATTEARVALVVAHPEVVVVVTVVAVVVASEAVAVALEVATVVVVVVEVVASSKLPWSPSTRSKRAQ